MDVVFKTFPTAAFPKTAAFPETAAFSKTAFSKTVGIELAAAAADDDDDVMGFNAVDDDDGDGEFRRFGGEDIAN